MDRSLLLSYEELRERAARLAGAIEGLGVHPGGRVAVLASNSHMMLEADYGVPLARAVLVALNMRLSARKLGYILDHSGARVLLCDEAREPLARAAIDAADADVTLPDAVRYERLLEGAQEAWNGVEDDRGLLSISYMSDTTGRPKGIMYQHRGACLQALIACHPAVLEVAVVGRPDERFGERPVAFVRLSPEKRFQRSRSSSTCAVGWPDQGALSAQGQIKR